MSEQVIDSLIGRLHDLADEIGWEFAIAAAATSTCSVYCDLWREARADDDTDESIEDYGLTGLEELRVRISDHGNAHYYDGELLHVDVHNPEIGFDRLRERLSQPQKV